MARKLRLEFAGACYHVRHRGNDRRDLFAQGGAESFLNPSPMPIQFPIRNFEVFSPAKFIAALVAQIPPKGVPLVRYYGWYSNKSQRLTLHLAQFSGPAHQHRSHSQRVHLPHADRLRARSAGRTHQSIFHRPRDPLVVQLLENFQRERAVAEHDVVE